MSNRSPSPCWRGEHFASVRHAIRRPGPVWNYGLVRLPPNVPIMISFGVNMFPTDKAINPLVLAQEAEARGFESVWFPEHSHIPTSRVTPVGRQSEGAAAARGVLAYP